MTGSLPTKKQRELLNFIDGFIKGNGYGPSYREIMRALGYKSVSTVASHVDGLIARGYLRRSDTYSARSLELVTPATSAESASDEPVSDKQHIDWLKSKRDTYEAESSQYQTLQSALDLLESPEK